MKYHYQQGIVERDKKGHPKLWLFIFLIIALIIYVAFSYTTVALNGWPLSEYDETAKTVKETKPGALGDYVFIPAINVASNIGGHVTLKGSPKEDTVSLSGAQFGVGVTPSQAKSASPFFNLEKLQNGDQIFIDKNKVRYAYEITQNPKSDVTVLSISNGTKSLQAEAIGTVAWQNDGPKLKTF